MSFIL